MKKLSTEKRNQIILVVMLTAMGLAGLWFGAIVTLQHQLKHWDTIKAGVVDDLAKTEQLRKNEQTIESNLKQATNELARVEEDMTTGDPYAWMLKTIGLLKLQHKVELPSLSPPDIKDTNLLPKFPYKQASYGIGGTAYFHDLGKFVADVENQYPYFRIVNLDISPEGVVASGDKEVRERITFHMDVITLIKPGGI